jgi:hypothetical protein
MNDMKNMITSGIKFFGPDEREYETTGERRLPRRGEVFINNSNRVTVAPHDYVDSYQIILRELPPPAKPRRVPTDADAIHRPQCWVRDSENSKWCGPHTLLSVADPLRHCHPFSVLRDGQRVYFRFCEIEDVLLGPILHWRDATSEDVGKWFQAVEFPDVTKFWDVELNKSGYARVLVEVGK